MYDYTDDDPAKVRSQYVGAEDDWARTVGWLMENVNPDGPQMEAIVEGRLRVDYRYNDITGQHKARFLPG